MNKIKKRTEEFANQVIHIISIPEIFPDIAIEDFEKISKALYKIATYEETHLYQCGNCRQFEVGVKYVCGLDIIEINFHNLLNIINADSEYDAFICYIKKRLEKSNINGDRYKKPVI